MTHAGRRFQWNNMSSTINRVNENSRLIGDSCSWNNLPQAESNIFFLYYKPSSPPDIIIKFKKSKNPSQSFLLSSNFIMSVGERRGL